MNQNSYTIDFMHTQGYGAYWWLMKDGRRYAPIKGTINDAKKVLHFIKKKGYLPAEIQTAAEKWSQKLSDL